MPVTRFLNDEIKEFYIVAMRFNNHKDIHVAQEAGSFLKSPTEARRLGMKIMDLRMVFVYAKDDGSPYHKMLDELTAMRKKYKYLLPYGFEIYKCNKDAGDIASQSIMVFKGK
jgi:phosphatidylserine/phosphatidylglycerophosphate/cardiolipin synthase-like enzyme